MAARRASAEQDTARHHRPSEDEGVETNAVRNAPMDGHSLATSQDSFAKDGSPVPRPSLITADNSRDGREREVPSLGYRFPQEYNLLANSSVAALSFTAQDVDQTRQSNDEGAKEASGFSNSPRLGEGATENGSSVQHVDSTKPSKITVTVVSPRASEASPSPTCHTRQNSDGILPSELSTPGGSDGGDSDDYDWSGEEDLADQQAKFNNQLGFKARREGWGFKRISHFLFSTLIGSTLLAGILITPPLIVHFYWYIPNPTDGRHFIDKNIQAWLFWAASNVVISWFLAMLIDIVPILIRYFLAITWGQVSETVKSRLETYNSVKNTAKPALYAASALSSWVIVFSHIYGMHSLNEDVASSVPYTDRAFQIVLFFFFVAFVICVQKMMSHLIAWNFHQLAYRERIHEVETDLSAIDKLKKYRPKTHKWINGSPQTPAGGNTFAQQSWQKDHYNMLNSALRSQAQSHKPSRLSALVSSPPPDSRDEGGEEDVNVAQNHRQKKKEERLSISPAPVSNYSASSKPPFAVHYHTATPSENECEDVPLGEIRPPTEQRNHTRPSSPSKLGPYPRFTPSASSYLDHDQRMQSPTGNGIGPSTGEATFVHAAKVLKKAVLHDARNLHGQAEDLSGLAWNVNSTQEAKRLARTIFRKLKDRHRKYLVAADFYPVFPTKEEAEAAFHIFDSDTNGDLSRAEIKIKLVRTYQERRFLSRSLKDVGEALRTLDRILLAFALVVLFFISLSVFGVNVGNSLASVYSIGIAASFIFKSSASRAFDAIMFLFVSHPYDTGDRIFIDEENLVVKKVGLFATVFARSDGTETYYFNSQLFSKFITNARRSDKTTEMLSLQVDWKTPLEKLDALEKCLNDWLSTEEKRWFQPKTGVTLQHIEFQRYLLLTIGIPHNGNWQDWGLHNTRKTAFHAAVQYYCRQLGITGYEPPIPVAYTEADALALAQSSNLARPTQLEHGSSPRTEREVGQKVVPGKHLKAALGFLPPDTFTSPHLARARKSRRSMKDNLGAMNAEC